jgi:uncharacterized protein (DUF697 family)
MPFGLTTRDVVGTVREVQSAARSSAPIVVLGFLADEVARGLRAHSVDTGAVRVGGGSDDAAALVVVVAGLPGASEERALRGAARHGTPSVVVQTDSRASAAVPYALATDIVNCPPGRGSPVPEIAAALAARLGHDGVALAARLPVLRHAICDELVNAAARRAALVGVAPGSKAAHFPAMALIQARLVLDLAAAHGQAIDAERAPELAAVAGTGLGLRAAVRRLPLRVPFVGALTGYVGTRAIGEAAIRRHARDVAVPPGAAAS